MSKRILIIGRGFIGQSIFNNLSKKNYDIKLIGAGEICTIDINYDFVIFASGNSSPRVSNTTPKDCLEQTCIALLSAIKIFEKSHWILISSTSVYELSNSQKNKEDDEILITDKNSIYSTHKILNEFYIKKYIKNYCIMRLSYTYGELSKKNIFFDLRKNNRKIYLNINSILRPLNIKHLIKSIAITIESEKKGIFNIANQNTIKIHEILSIKNNEYEYKNERYINESNICTKKFVSEYQFSETKIQLMRDIEDYLISNNHSNY